MPTNPYGSTTGLPAPTSGVDDGESLRLAAISRDPVTGAWRPALTPGGYSVSGESAFRTLTGRPVSVPLTLAPGMQVLTAVLPVGAWDPAALAESPAALADGAGALTPVCNPIRFAQAVPPGNVLPASTLLDARWFTDGALSPSQPFWWFPLFGGECLAAHRSRDPRSLDVLSDRQAVLQEASSPAELAGAERGYVQDRTAGLVFGPVPAESLPPPPYGSGRQACVYVTALYGSECDLQAESGSCSAAGDAFWVSYLDALPASGEGGAGRPPYDPLRCEEIGYVDRDGFVRARRSGVLGPTDLGGAYAPSLFVPTPDGPLLCTTTTVTGNLLDAQLPDPSQGGALAPLPYGTTVVLRYWVDRSFCLLGLSAQGDGLSARVRVLTAAAGSAEITWDADPSGAASLQSLGGSPDLNPLTSQTHSGGFLYLEDAAHPAPVAPSQGGRLDCPVSCPAWNGAGGQGEVWSLRAAALDADGVPIPACPLTLTAAPSGSVVLAPAGTLAGPDGTLSVRARLATGAGPITLTLTDTRTAAVLASLSLSPSEIGGTDAGAQTDPWDPTPFISLGEDYRSAGTGASRRTVSVCVIGPDGFPWLGRQSVGGGPDPGGPATVVLSSARSVFHDPAAADAPLGSRVAVSWDDGSGLLSPAGVLRVGYAPVPGDTLTALVYVGLDRYAAFPVAVA